MRYFFIILLAYLFYPDSTTVNSKNTVESPIIAFKPAKLIVKNPKQQFISENINFINKGIGELTIESIESSCKCASATILNNGIEPMSIGKIRLSINLESIDGNIFEFYIRSNANNSPITYRVYIEYDSSNIGIDYQNRDIKIVR